MAATTPAITLHLFNANSPLESFITKNSSIRNEGTCSNQKT